MILAINPTPNRLVNMGTLHHRADCSLRTSKSLVNCCALSCCCGEDALTKGALSAALEPACTMKNEHAQRIARRVDSNFGMILLVLGVSIMQDYSRP